MRGIPSLITDIRKKVFVEVARMAYAGNGYEAANELPYKIVPGDRPLHREDVFLERAIAGERVLFSFGQVVFTAITARLGTVAMAAHSIALTAEQAFYIPGYGMQTAAATLAGTL